MVETHDHFTKRLGKLGRKHEKMTHGYTTKVGKDGLITVTPKARRVRGVSGIRLLLLAGFGFFAIKAFMLASTGPDAYADRLAALDSGTVFERAGAKVMGVDPITERLAHLMGPILR
ncbi:hypothetical protein [Sulfitobacter sp. JB4-11]|uniref:hypothetical protein n=1 Tax=Sulfitobacter rhodophyticola TaxID=3238304 RepID=UPI003516F315